MENFILNLWNCWTLIDVTLIMLFAILSLFYFLRFRKVQKKLGNYQFFSGVSAQTIEDYEHQIHLQEEKEKELKKAFEDAVAEITELRSKNNELKLKNIDLSNKLTRRYQLRDKSGRFISNKVKQVDSEWWKCLVSSYGKYFTIGKKYQVSKEDKIIKDDSFLLLITNEGISGLCRKTDFKPVEK